MKIATHFLLLLVALCFATGCDRSASPGKKTNVDVKVGGGEGVKVDVDSKPSLLPKKDTDVDIDVGGVKIDVDAKK